MYFKPGKSGILCCFFYLTHKPKKINEIVSLYSILVLMSHPLVCVLPPLVGTDQPGRESLVSWFDDRDASSVCLAGKTSGGA